MSKISTHQNIDAAIMTAAHLVTSFRKAFSSSGEIVVGAISFGAWRVYGSTRVCPEDGRAHAFRGKAIYTYVLEWMEADAHVI